MLKLHCDNPACETEVEWSSADRLPVGWFEVSQVVPDGGGGVEFIVCGAPCVRGLHEQLLEHAAEPVVVRDGDV